MRAEDEVEHTRGGQAYYRPCGWQRFALDVKDKYSLADLPAKDLIRLLRQGGGKHPPPVAGMERAQLEQLAAATGGEEYARAWLGDSNGIGEWVNAYHGTAGEVAPAIARSGLRRGRSADSGAAAVASFLAAVLTEIYLCGVCSCQELLRRKGADR
jgi:hypothetical protein